MDTESESGSGKGPGPGKSPGSRKTQFKPGEKHGKARKEGDECQVTTGPPTNGSIYEDMKFVSNLQYLSECRTPRQRRYFRWMEGKPDLFNSKLVDLERAALSAAGQQSKNSTGLPSTDTSGLSGSPSLDPGTERVREQIPLEFELVEWIDNHKEEARAWAVSRGYEVPKHLEGP